MARYSNIIELQFSSVQFSYVLCNAEYKNKNGIADIIRYESWWTTFITGFLSPWRTTRMFPYHGIPARTTAGYSLSRD
jgi:hypothetical protein